MRGRAVPAAVACAILVCHTAAGQVGGRAPVRANVAVHGVVFDSVRGRPLRDAFVTIVGDSQHTTTDEQGRFYFDRVPAGVHTFAVHHTELDSLGFSGLSRRAEITGDETEITVAVPSFGTLWSRACAGKPPSDSGLIYGTIRDAATSKPLAGADVEIMWSEIATDQSRHKLIDRRWRNQTLTDATGSFAACGVPMDAALGLRARAKDSSASGWLILSAAGARVQRHDLYIARAGAIRASIIGLLTDASGGPFADARVTLEDSAESRSDLEGRFEFHNVAAGSRQLTIRYVGIPPVSTVVHVTPGDTVMVALRMPRVTTLATVNVSSTERARVLLEEYENRRVMYHHFMMDSLAVASRNSLLQVFYDQPGLTVKRFPNGDFTVQTPNGKGGKCTPELRVDGTPVNDFGYLLSLATNRIVSVEIYSHAFDVPAEYMHAGIEYPCGLVAVWTKWAFRLP